MLAISDAATNWAFDVVTDASGVTVPDGGIVIQNVRHDGHNFANDIRALGFWIEYETVEPNGKVAGTSKTFYALTHGNFKISPIEKLTPIPFTNPITKITLDYLRDADAALDFAEYFKDLTSPGKTGSYVGVGVKVVMDSPEFFKSQSNCELLGLRIEQIFLFSRLGNKPPHEPSGALEAARCHPLIRYEMTKNPELNPAIRRTRYKSIRFDYRLHLRLDRHHDLMENAKLAPLGNQAGFFADSDTLAGTLVTAIVQGAWNLPKGIGKAAATAVSKGAFDSVEKPLIFEVTAPGLLGGFPIATMADPSGKPINVRGWDNVHWWAARGAGNPIISAPGGFHAAHIHWRWGAAAAPDVNNDPRFEGKAWPQAISGSPIVSMWGPVIDPAIWTQTIRVAVTLNHAKLDPTKGVASFELSRPDWKTLFDPGISSKPSDISAGADIVLWYSAQVDREIATLELRSSAAPNTPTLPSRIYGAKLAGTIFVHGIFFAHGPEKTGLKVGSTDPAHWPKSVSDIRHENAWFRPAKIT